MKRATPLGWLKHDVTNRGITAWLLAAIFLAFYVLLYFGHDIANFYAKTDSRKICYDSCLKSSKKSVCGPKCYHGKKSNMVVVRNGWPMLHNILFLLVLLGLIIGGLALFREQKASGDEDAKPNRTLAFMGGGIALAVLMYALPELYHGMGFAGQPFSDFSKSIGLPGKWMLYGLIYSVLICSGGAYMIWKYRHNRYQIVRTCVVMFVQVVFGFSIPWIMKLIKQPDYYFSYMWPLKTSYFYPSTVAYQIKSGLPVPIIAYSFVAGLIIAPVLAVFFGKRWYCSWVCGCGGLANTFGEPWRHLSTKSSRSWKIEKWTIHGFLLLTLFVTAMAILSGFLPTNAATVKGWYVKDPAAIKSILATSASVQAFDGQLRHFYAVLVTAVLSGIVGVGLYPLGGTRLWCRFACPMAALLGLLQKFGRFRIRVKRDMCISCGMCSKYCEMGIDVRSYAQANESFTRASCVGCGLCAEVCPRGVLKLENIERKDPQEVSNVFNLQEVWKGDQSNINARD